MNPEIITTLISWIGFTLSVYMLTRAADRYVDRALSPR